MSNYTCISYVTEVWFVCYCARLVKNMLFIYSQIITVTPNSLHMTSAHENGPQQPARRSKHCKFQIIMPQSKFEINSCSVQAFLFNPFPWQNMEIANYILPYVFWILLDQHWNSSHGFVITFLWSTHACMHACTHAHMHSYYIHSHR